MVGYRARWTALALVAAPWAIAAAPVAPGQLAPGFRLTTFTGDKVVSTDLRGKVVVINHWATWCGPCKAELPAMDAYYRTHSDKGLVIFAVTSEDSLPKYMLKGLSAAMAIPLANHFRGTGYGPIKGAVPTSYIIDRAGVVRYARSGAFNADSFARTLDPLLAEPAAGH